MTTSPVMTVTDELLAEIMLDCEDSELYQFGEYHVALPTARVVALVEHIRSLTEQLAAANEKIDRAWGQPYTSTLDLEGYIPGALDAWKRPVKQHLSYGFSGAPEASDTQYCNGWNDAGGYWKSYVISLTERLEKAEPGWAKLDPTFVAEHLRQTSVFDADLVEAMLQFAIDAAIAQEGQSHE